MLNLYNPAHLAVKKTLALPGGEFKAFTYKNSLRFNILLRDAPDTELTDQLLKEIKHLRRKHRKRLTLLWYSQIEGFSTAFLDRLNCTDPNHFFLFRLEHDAICADVDLRGLRAEKCTPELLDACVEILEDAFTPFPDAPGSFRNDRERVEMECLHERGGAMLFYQGDDPVGLCGHMEGHITSVAVRKEYQGRGYGEAMLRAVLRSIREMGRGAELCVSHDNARAIALYQKVGFQKVYESMQVTLR